MNNTVDDTTAKIFFTRNILRSLAVYVCNGSFTAEKIRNLNSVYKAAWIL